MQSCLSLVSYGIYRRVPPQWTMTQLSLCWMNHYSFPHWTVRVPLSSIDWLMGRELAQQLTWIHKVLCSIRSRSKNHQPNTNWAYRYRSTPGTQFGFTNLALSFCQCYNVLIALICVVLKPRYWILQVFFFYKKKILLAIMVFCLFFNKRFLCVFLTDLDLAL